MNWTSSQFAAGDLVEVKSQEEILTTLDAEGCVGGMPFMPEMLTFCGRQMRVRAVAHKTCDTVHKSGGRRLERAVHLEDSRCDGSAHGGCQAECSLFWRDEWLRPVGTSGRVESPRPGVITADVLESLTVAAPADPECPRYVCQATRLHSATAPLSWWNARQYLRDVATRNHPPGTVAIVLMFAFVRWVVSRVPLGYRPARALSDRLHCVVTGRPAPEVEGRTPSGSRTPTGRLDLQPGERVRVRPPEQIFATLDPSGKNRGLSFDPEMMPYCGREFTVSGRVEQIVDESTGVLVRMKHPCITLQGAACQARASACRLLCPRAIPSYWREIWLERVDEPSTSPQTAVPGGAEPGLRVD